MKPSFLILAALVVGAPVILAASGIAAGAVAPHLADSRAVLPREAAPKAAYARYYLLSSIRSEADLPFTTTSAFRLPTSRRVWLGVLAIPSSGDASGVRTVRSASGLPQIVHGGCRVVNLIADARTGETLASWCNIDDAAPIDGMPTPVPTYIPEGSPFR